MGRGARRTGCPHRTKATNVKRVQPFVVLNALVLALALICAAAVLGLPDSLVLAAERPGHEQTKNTEKPKASEAKSQGAAKNSSSEAGKAAGNGKPVNDNKQDRSSPPSSAAPERVVNPVVVQPLPTASSVPRVSLDSITVIDPCQMRGSIAFSGPYWGKLTLELTYHVTGNPDFTGSGVTWSRTFAGETSSDYSLSMRIPEPEVEPGRRVNSFRVEVASSDPRITNPTVKSTSFHCEDVTAESTVQPSVTPLPTLVTLPVTTASATPAATDQPSATPVATDQPLTATAVPVTSTAIGPSDPDETPKPTATFPTQAITQTPSGTPVPVPTPTATATPTPFAIWTTRIVPDRVGNADPGAEVLYTHTITNEGTYPDIKEVRVASSLGWVTDVLGGDGNTSLPDSDHDGTPDTGVLMPGQSKEIAVRLRVPEGSGRGTTNVTTVTAASSADPSGDGTATVSDTTTVNGIITVSVSTRNVTFGDISPLGAVPSGSSGLTSDADEQGAYYTKSPAVRVTVNSNAPWTGSLSAQENDGSSRAISVADGDLKWRLQGSANWNVFTSGSSGMSGADGTSDLVYDYQLRVQWDDDPGSFSSVVTYNATQ